MHSVAVIYLVLLLFLIYRTGSFGMIRDDRISATQFTWLFLLKALAVPVFSLVYAKFYGGVEGLDAGVFYKDAKAVHAFALSDPGAYLKLMFGLLDDSEGSYVYRHCLVHTQNWDNGKIRDFFYNDNRIVIRLHSLIHFIAFNSYFVHALLSCFLSFIGIVYLYKSFKEFFPGKELWLLFVFCFFPTLWFYTGAVSKEGIALFVLGCSVYSLKKLIYRQAAFRDVLWLALLLATSCFLKPYLLCSAALCFALFFFLHRFQVRYRILYFMGALIFCGIAVNGLSILVRHKSLSHAAFARQRIFADAARGGIFLIDSVEFIRLDYDSTLVKKAGAGYYTIKKDIPYIYWEHSHQEDTLFCTANKDTTRRYQMVYQLPESGSNFDLSVYSGGKVRLLASCLYYSLFYPFFINAKGLLQMVASLENLLILLSLLIVLTGLVRNRKDNFPVLVFMVFALGLCILVGLTTPNSGAIFRYRSPAVIFILAAALYYWVPLKARARAFSQEGR